MALDLQVVYFLLLLLSIVPMFEGTDCTIEGEVVSTNIYTW